MTTLITLLQSFTAQVVMLLEQLPTATRDAARLSVVLQTTDGLQTVQVQIEGAIVTVTENDAPAHIRLTAPFAVLANLMQHGSMRFVTEPIINGKLRNLYQLHGALRLLLTDGDAVLVRFNDATQPEAVIKISQADAIGLLSGTLNPQVAFMTGRLQIVSGMSFLMSLERIM